MACSHRTIPRGLVESGTEMNPFTAALGDLRQRDQLRTLSALDGLPEKFLVRNGKPCLNLSSNNYLGLTGHAEVRRAAAEAALSLGTGSGGSRLLGGGLPLHRKLEESVVAFRPLGNALLFNTGFMANLGVIQALAPVLGTIYSDKFNHASIAEGLRKSSETFHRYRHRDMNHLESLLVQHQGKGESGDKPGLVCSETLFSMDGDFAPLSDLLALQARFGFYLYLDEAHSTGCYPGLMNDVVRAGVTSQRILIMGTFGKAFGGFGAYVAGPDEAIEYMLNTARTFIFSTALPPAPVAAALAALKVAQAEPWRAEKLAVLSTATREMFHARKLNTGTSESHIVPVLTGSNAAALRLSEYMLQAGYHAPAVRPPTVPAGTARLRINLTCEMELSEMEALSDVLAQGMLEVGNA